MCVFVCVCVHDLHAHTHTHSTSVFSHFHCPAIVPCARVNRYSQRGFKSNFSVSLKEALQTAERKKKSISVGELLLTLLGGSGCRCVPSDWGTWRIRRVLELRPRRPGGERRRWTAARERLNVTSTSKMSLDLKAPYKCESIYRPAARAKSLLCPLPAASR